MGKCDGCTYEGEELYSPQIPKPLKFCKDCIKEICDGPLFVKGCGDLFVNPKTTGLISKSKNSNRM